MPGAAVPAHLPPNADEQERYYLKFSSNAVCAWEQETGESFFSLISGIENPEAAEEAIENLSFTKLRALLWAALQERHNVTIKEAGELMGDFGDFGAAVEIIFEAIDASSPSEEDLPDAAVEQLEEGGDGEGNVHPGSKGGLG